jgi:hypothetical protein
VDDDHLYGHGLAGGSAAKVAEVFDAGVFGSGDDDVGIVLRVEAEGGSEQEGEDKGEGEAEVEVGHGLLDAV